MKIAVGIASSDRREILADTIRHLTYQLRRADQIVICPALPQHFDRQAAAKTDLPIMEAMSRPGLPAQRNAIMASCDADVLVFFDDDFLPAPDFLQMVETLFRVEPDVVVATGLVLADGISGPGLDYEEGCRLLDKGLATARDNGLSSVFNAYGCNMVLRMDPVRRHGLRFDEVLPLYAWLEDVDFSRQLAAYGRIVKADALRGVHLGTKRSGRTPGRKLGYSQIANRVYLARKGSLPWWMALHGMSKNLAANLVRLARPEPWIDRKGRLRGNILAFQEWMSGRITPQRIIELD